MNIDSTVESVGKRLKSSEREYFKYNMKCMCDRRINWSLLVYGTLSLLMIENRLRGNNRINHPTTEEYVCIYVVRLCNSSHQQERSIVCLNIYHTTFIVRTIRLVKMRTDQLATLCSILCASFFTYKSQFADFKVRVISYLHKRVESTISSSNSIDNRFLFVR